MATNMTFTDGVTVIPADWLNNVNTIVNGGIGSGTVTSVSVASANGFAGTVATATSTPAITLRTTITGLLKGNGTAISAAVAGTDYLVPPAGTSLLKANSGGALANATSGTDYAPGTAALASGLVYSTTATGALSIASPGVDYARPTAALATGILKNTTGTGVLSIATAGSDYMAAVAPSTSGNVLTSNGTDWVSSAPSSGMTLVTSTTAAAASAVDFTNLSASYDYYVVYENVTNSIGATLQLRVSSDNGSSFLSTTIYNFQQVQGSNATINATMSTAATQADLAGNLGTTTTTHGNLFLWSLNTSVGVKGAKSYSGVYATAPSTREYLNSIFIASSTAMNAIRLFPSAGTMSGTFRLYRIARS